jgi:hypothetical protein
MQRQMGEFAVKAMDLPLSERDMSGVTMGITHRAYEQIKKEIADFRRRIVAIASADDDTEQVYRLNVQLFPLSERLGKKREIETEKEERNEKIVYARKFVVALLGLCRLPLRRLS